EPTEHISSILFTTGLQDPPALVAIPCRDGVLQFDYWLRLPAIMNHHLNRWDISSVGLQSHTFYHLPTSNAPRFQTAYTIKYWSQDMKMPINQALLSCCNNTPSHHLLRGDLIVIKHLHTPLNILQNMQEEDMALVTALIRWSVSADKRNNFLRSHRLVRSNEVISCMLTRWSTPYTHSKMIELQ
ncbi:hypothetical protein EV363DRAFT_1180266, partial [Boletus edulis]